MTKVVASVIETILVSDENPVPVISIPSTKPIVEVTVNVVDAVLTVLGRVTVKFLIAAIQRSLVYLNAALDWVSSPRIY